MHFVCICSDVWMWDVCLSGKINPWLLLRNFGKLNPRLPLGMKSIHIFKICWKDASVGEYLLNVNCYLAGSRFHNMLRMRKSTAIWSDPGFTVTYWGRNKLSIIWSDSRLRRRFLEVELIFGRIQASQQLARDKEVNSYLWSNLLKLN